MLKRGLCLLALLTLLPICGGAEMTDPALLPERDDLPELMTFADGSPVAAAED